MIGIPRNGFKTSRSLSPVIMQPAFPDKASSRYILLSNTTRIYSSLSKSSSFSFVRPCLAAYSPNSSITSRTGLGLRSQTSIRRDNCFFLSSDNCSTRFAVSSITCKVMVFMIFDLQTLIQMLQILCNY